jgi:hypothetical protein
MFAITVAAITAAGMPIATAYQRGRTRQFHWRCQRPRSPSRPSTHAMTVTAANSGPSGRNAPNGTGHHENT